MSLKISAAASRSGRQFNAKKEESPPPWSQSVSPVDTKLGLMSKSDFLYNPL